jgi:hypothetical protein
MSAPVLDATVVQDDIRDIRGPIDVPQAASWALLSALMLATVLAGFGIVRLVRYWRGRQPSAYQQAKLRLHDARQEAELGDADRLAERVSGAVREYIEARFAVRAAHRTTEDFLSELLLRPDTRLSSYRIELERFLGTCDLAKFAGQDLPRELRRELCSAAARFVEAAEMALEKGERT